MKRRTFVNLAAGAGLASLLPSSLNGQTNNNVFRQGKIKPKQLQKGDTIALIAPGYALAKNKLEQSIKNLKALGFKPYYTNRIHGNHGYFSDTDEERLADIHEAFANPTIKGIICARGGYGCTRLLSKIDYSLIQQNPKVLMGYSDITALSNAIYQKTGLVTFHGPVASSFEERYPVKHFKNVIMKPKENLKIKLSTADAKKSKTVPEFERYTVNPGIAEGELSGGNLSLMVAMMGTPYEVTLENKLVFIEDIEEQPYRIDRMLTQLIESGKLAKAKGIILGVFDGCNSSTNKLSFSLKEVILDRIQPLGIPAAYGFSIGHIANQCTLPVGMNAVVDTQKMTITLPETSVI